VSGVVYRVVAKRLDRLDESFVLPVPLTNIPLEIGDWWGEEICLSETVKKIAGNDDYLNRIYRNDSAGQWANVYIGYTANPRTMLGHRPQVCYPAHGWERVTSDEIVLKCTGREVPALIHRFQMPETMNEVVVLNFYVLNGQTTNDEKTFDSLRYRTPNISGDIARYVAQVQISSVLENSVRTAAKEMAEVFLEYLPETRVGE
jgi:EpsI family protein